MDDSQFLRAQNLGFEGLDHEGEGKWQDDFMFAQLADTQYGLHARNKSWESEIKTTTLAVEHINRLKPKFVVICGDLINAYPNDKEREVQANQVQDLKKTLSQIDESIPLVCLCGNHDIGDRPSNDSIELYKKRFGDDYFSFWVAGIHCIVINSSLYSDGTDVPERVKEHDKWLDEVLATKGYVHRFVFSHIPPFILKPDEPDGYFNLEPTIRHNLLDRFKKGGVTKWFCGHYHRNAGGWDENLEVVITSAVGVTLTPIPGADPLGLEGFTLDFKCQNDTSGFRLVKVQKSHVRHRWYTLDSVPEKVDPKREEWEE